MNEKEKLDIITNMQQVVEQMRLDDISDNPDSEHECFDCDCCGEYKPLAGSIQYGDVRLCNDCVLLAETGFAIKKFNNIDELINAMEDTRLEEICEFIKMDKSRINN